MFKINENYLKLPGSYLFSTIAKKVSAFTEANPDKPIIRLGIGDVTQPLAPAVIQALHSAVDEMGNAETFHGYAPDLGYSFLRETIAKEDYEAKAVRLRQTKSSCRMGPKVIPPISRRFSAMTVKLLCATRCIQYMWTAM